jgi:hypothetical protein
MNWLLREGAPANKNAGIGTNMVIRSGLRLCLHESADGAVKQSKL